MISERIPAFPAELLQKAESKPPTAPMRPSRWLMNADLRCHEEDVAVCDGSPYWEHFGRIG